MTSSRTWLRAAPALAVVGLVLFALALPAAAQESPSPSPSPSDVEAAGQSPSPSPSEVLPGNNGVVKVDGRVFDRHTDDEAHVSCLFDIDFYNYDEGPYRAEYQFEVIPPTGAGIIEAGEVFIGEDPPGGGEDHDGHVTVDLTAELSKFQPEEQGYHVRLTVNAPFSQGADMKQKVFWVECQAAQAAAAAAFASPSPSPSPQAVSVLPNTGADAWRWLLVVAGLVVASIGLLIATRRES